MLWDSEGTSPERYISEILEIKKAIIIILIIIAYNYIIINNNNFIRIII